MLPCRFTLFYLGHSNKVLPKVRGTLIGWRSKGMHDSDFKLQAIGWRWKNELFDIKTKFNLYQQNIRKIPYILHPIKTVLAIAKHPLSIQGQSLESSVNARAINQDSSLSIKIAA